MVRIFTTKVIIMCLAALFCLSSSFAQKQSKLDIALEYIEQKRSDWQLTSQDVQNLQVSDQYTSQNNGLTHIYFIQRHAGIPLYNGILNVNVLPNDDILYASSQFLPNLAEAVNTTLPDLSPRDAILAAAQHFGLRTNKTLLAIRKDDAQTFYFDGGELSNSEIKVQLQYQRMPNKTARLAWDLALDMKNSSDYWSVRVDAVTGEILDQHNYTVYCAMGNLVGHKHNDGCTNYVDNVAQSPSMFLNDGATYNVFPLPIESPIHGERELVVNPADTVASPFGWHDTDGMAGAEYMITRGNNVHAFADTADTDVSQGNEPFGGEELVFDFPFNPEVSPDSSLDFAVTQLFYTNNMMHDFAFAYGFTEEAGNFQVTNYSGKGTGDDYVLAQAQDGGGTNNANFATPPDGGRGRMQMYLWNRSGLLTVKTPLVVAGIYETSTATFGPEVGDEPISGAVEIVSDGSFNPTLGCEALGNDLTGKIALVDRGECFFSEKAFNAQEAGAIGVIVCNYEGGALVNMSAGTEDPITIPVVMINYGDCLRLREYAGSELEVELVRPEGQGPSFIDGTLDNGIVAHEYGHGISNRLTGGPNAAGCLSNDEQMGEGWSDFFTLVTTVKSGDTGERGRGIGTYALRQDVSGGGIRRFPYSNDMDVNPQTLNDVVGTTSPHQLGEIWAAVLWDLYWAMVDEHGFDEDQMYGTGGNNMAIQLVMDGMKIQPCNPGILDGRDALLAADKANYDGANQCLIWDVFARRGMGWSADQRNKYDRNDAKQAFDIRPDCIKALTIEKQVSELVEAGDTVTINLLVTNYKDETVTDVEVTDEIPTDWNLVTTQTIVEVSPVRDNNVSFDNNMLSVRFDSLLSGESVTLTYQAVTAEEKFSVQQFFDDVESGDEAWTFFPLEGDDIWWIEESMGIDSSAAWAIPATERENDQTFVNINPLLITGEQPVLRFYHSFDTEWAYDGGIVQISNDGGTSWQDVSDQFIRGGYESRLDYNAFALANQNGYTGLSNQFKAVYVDMSAYIGQEVLLRFRFGTDDDTQGGSEHYGSGWVVDNIELMDMLHYNTEACVTSAQNDQTCVVAKERGTVIESAEMLPTSVEETTQQSLQVQLFPNPVEDILQLSISSDWNSDLQLSIFTLDGREVLSRQLDIQKGFRTIPVAVNALVPGLYVVKVQAGDEVVVQKVVVQ